MIRLRLLIAFVTVIALTACGGSRNAGHPHRPEPSASAVAESAPRPLGIANKEGTIQRTSTAATVEITPDAMRPRLEQRPGKYKAIRIEPHFVISGDGVQRIATDEMVADHLLVTFSPGVDETAVKQKAADLGFAVRRRIGRSSTYLISFPADDADALPKARLALARSAAVANAEPDYLVHAFLGPVDPSFSQQWALNNSGQTGGNPDADIDAPEAWNLSVGSDQVKVGVIDTGIDYNHPDLADNIWTNPNEIAGNGIDDDHNGYIDDVHGWDFANGDPDPNDDCFHGTHCAGTIGASGNNNIGVTGVCWRVKLVALKFLDGSGSGYTSDAVEAVRYATAIGVRLTSNSWGGGGFDQALKDAIDDAGAAGILFVAAAGNESSDNDAVPSYPASFDCANIISVAATDHTDGLAGFSNRGAASVDLGAPGVNILSTFPTVQTPEMRADGFSPFYGTISGTSMATPHVAGACALLAAYDASLNGAQIKTRLLTTIDPIQSLTGRCLSEGRLNLDHALRNQRASLIFAAITQPTENALLSGQFSITGTADATDFVRFAIDWGFGDNPGQWFSSGIVLANNGLAPVSSSKLADWTLTGVEGTRTLRLFVVGANGQKTVLRRVSVDLHLKPGFPTYAWFGGGTYGAGGGVCLVAADLTGDGNLELIGSSTAQGPLYACDSLGRSLPGWPFDQGGVVYPAALDTDGDGRAEVAANSWAGDFWGLLGANAAYLPGWPGSVPNYCTRAPVLADVDGDGKADVIVGQEDTQVRIYRQNGTPLPGWPKRISSSQRIEAPIVGDFDGVPGNEVLVLDTWTSADFLLFAWHADGTLLPGWPKNLGSRYGYCLGVVMGDIDGDGRQEAVATRNGKVLALRADGSSPSGWPFSLPDFTSQLSPPILADVDNDGKPEVIFVADTYPTGTLYVVRGNGTVAAGWPRSSENYYWNAWGNSYVPVAGDIDGDGGVDIVMGYTLAGNGVDAKLYAYHANGSPLSGFPKRVPLGAGSVPVIADIDNDGRNELAVYSTAWDGRSGMKPHIFAWDFNAPGTRSGRIEWGQYGRDSGHSGWYRPAASAPVNGASFVAQSAPSDLMAGQTYQVSVSMKNTGTTTWTSAGQYRLGSQSPQDNLTWGVNRVSVPAAIAPGAQATFSFTVTAPSAAGVYAFRWRMVQDGVEWFGDASPELAITVSQPNRSPVIAGPASATPNPAASGQNISFTVAASDADGDALSYIWTFGDGANGSGASSSHAYASAGAYTAQVTVSDGRGGVATSSVTVTVGNPSSDLLEGSFESPFAGPSWVWGSFIFPQSGSAWTFAGGAGITANGSGYSAGNPGAPDGAQAALLQGIATISQSVNLPAGSYVIEFRAAQRANWQQSYQVLRIAVDGVPVTDVRPSGGDYQAITSGAFTVAAGTHVLSISGINPNGGDNTAFVDQVSVRSAPNIVAGIAEGGFETPVVGAANDWSSFRYVPSGSAWTFTGGAGISANGSGFTYGNAAAPEGGQVALLQGSSAISQSVVLGAGTYALGFDAAQRLNWQQGYQVLRVEVDGVAVGDFVPGGNYQRIVTPSFTLGAGSHVISLIGVNPLGGDNTVFVDAVVLTQSAPTANG